MGGSEFPPAPAGDPGGWWRLPDGGSSPRPGLWASGTCAATSHKSLTMAVAFSGPFGISLCPSPSDSVLLGRRVTPWQESGQEQNGRNLTHAVTLSPGRA